MTNAKEIKKQIIKIGRKLYKKGFVPGLSGNISFRSNYKIYITTSGACLGNLSESDITIIDFDGNDIENTMSTPSSESKMHVEIYKIRPDIKCIIHAHPPFCTTLSVIGKDASCPILAEQVVLIGDVPIVKYKLPSSIELAKEVAAGFEKHNAVLMANHGIAICGIDLKETFYKLETMEFYSQVYFLSELSGKRSELSKENVKELISLRNLKKR